MAQLLFRILRLDWKLIYLRRQFQDCQNNSYLLYERTLLTALVLEKPAAQPVDSIHIFGNNIMDICISLIFVKNQRVIPESACNDKKLQTTRLIIAYVDVKWVKSRIYVSHFFLPLLLFNTHWPRI